MDAWGAIAAVAGILGTLAGLIRWLLQAYFAKAEELEALKKSNQVLAIQDLRDTVDSHKAEIRRHSGKLDDTDKVLHRSSMQLQKISESLEEKHDEYHSRFQRIESEIIQLKKGLVMVRTKNGAKKAD